MKKFSFTILCLVVLGIGYCIGYFFGANEYYGTYVDTGLPAFVNKTESILQLRAENIAMTNLLHRVYGNMDNECWEDLIMSTPEYWTLDSVLHEGAGWEDFYAPAWDEPCAGYADRDTCEIPVGYDYL